MNTIKWFGKAMLALLVTIFGIILILVILYFLMGLIFTIGEEKPPRGYYKKEEYYDKTGIQDFTDYCKYYYKEKDDDKFIKNEKYIYVDENIMKEVIGYFDDFEGWMLPERSDEYDFDKTQITIGDYVLIDDEERNTYKKYNSYNVFFYDIETHTLYYIHNNI